MSLPVGSRGVTGASPADPVNPMDAEDLRARVHKALADHLATQADVLDAVSDDLAPLMDSVGDLLTGGKRLRAAFCYWGWRGAGGEDCAGIVSVASALELFQAAALIHDDVMDGSDTRRGQPAVHRRFAALHRGNHWLGSSADFGVAGAILAGDLCLSWCDEMYAASGLPPESLAAGRSVFDLMRTELMCGQYLDMLEQVQATTTVERARHVILYKSAKYSVQQPLLLGGTLAGAPAELLRTYDIYGRAVGEAFQLRDDVLGVFGDAQVTGKPAGDDLREGKRTALIALARQALPAPARRTLDELLGDPALDEAQIGMLQGAIRDSGALDEVERHISTYAREADRALAGAPLGNAAVGALRDLADAAVRRQS
jgi:geranylgeranyl diphosphate synthase type I